MTKPFKKIRNAAYLALWACLLPTLSTANSNKIDISAAPSLNYFSFEEFDQGRKLNRESGTLSGIQLTSTKQWLSGYIKGQASLAKGNVTHRGQTQIGSAVKTTTQYNKTDFWLQAGWHTFTLKPFQLSLIAGLGHNSSKRDILSTNDAIGVIERYRWIYYSAGSKIKIKPQKKHEWFFELHARQPTHAKISVNFKTNLDKASINLSGAPSLYSSIGWQYALNKSLLTELNISYTSWRINRSGSQNLTRDQLVIGSVFQPANKSQNYSLALSLKYQL